MYTKSISSLLAACLGILMLFSSCLDINTTSQVNSDGSILRTITIADDSASIYSADFPFVIDSTWSRTIEHGEKEKQFKLTATKLFQNVGEMNRAFAGSFGKTLQYRFELEKSFRWFFITYRYREINLPYMQYNSIPATDYFSAAEIEFHQRHPDDVQLPLTRGDSLAMLALGPRVEEYESRNRFEPIFGAFINGVKLLNDPSLTPTVVEQQKDALFKRSAKYTKGEKVDTIEFVFAGLLKTPLVHKAWLAGARSFDEIRSRLTFEDKAKSNSYVTNVVMPGLITNTNAGTVEGNRATWRDFKNYAHESEYTMWVESREVNWWAVILAGAIVLTMMIFWVATMLVRKRRV
jgi:hypothetical protein